MNNFTQSIFTISKNSFKNFVAVCSFLLVSGLSFGQVWNYNFGTGTGTFTSSTASTTFLPTPTSGTARVRVGTNPGSFTLANPGIALGTNSELQFTSNTGSTSTSKFSIHDYTASKVGFMKFKIAFNGGTNGVYLLSIGDGATFSDNNAMSTAQTFSSIRWAFGASNTITYNVLNSATYGTTGISSPTTLFAQSTSNEYLIEVYMNNNTTTTSYSRSGSNSLASATWDLWVNGTKVGSNLAKGGLASNVNIDSFAINHQSSSTSPGTVYIDDIEYANTLPNAVTSIASGNWSSTSTWSGGVIPTSADNAVIANGHVVVMDSGTYATRNAGTTTTVDAGGTLATNQTYVNNGTTTVNGSFRLDDGGWVSDVGGTNALVYGTNGTLIFNTSASYGANNGNYWPSTSGPVNVTINSGGINLGFNRTVSGTFQTAAGVTLSSSVLTLNGICQLNGGGFFNNSPTYGAASTLVYNTAYGVSNEWTGNGVAGIGIPANVRVQSGTLTLTTSDRGIPGNMTIDATCSLTLNGTSGDLYIGGNWNNAGTFTPNGRAVFFNGATNQTITNTTGETFNYLINNKSAGNLILANNVTVNATAGSPLQILNAGVIDLNGQTLILANNGGNIQVTGGARSITSSVAGGILSITGTKTVTSTSSGTLTLGTNVTTNLTNGINFGASLTTIEGKLQVNAGGYVISNAPIYASTSTLEYNAVTGYGVNNEWTGNAAVAGVGTPQNVTITNSSVNLPNAVRSLAGNLTIGSSSTLNMNGAVGADLNIGGNWNNAGTFNPNNRLVTFRGASAQTLTGATIFDYLKMDNSAGLTLNNSITNTFTLDLTSGVITLGTNNLTIGSAGTVINASATSYVRTNSTGQFKRTVGASASLFPTGNSAYNPIIFNNSGTSDEYGVRVLDGALTTGVNNTKTVSRSWIATETTAGGSNLSVVAQYNSGEENTNFIAGTNPKIGFYNGSTWVETVATAAGSNPVTYSSNTNVTPSDLTSGTQYFAIGKDNAFLSAATKFVITSITPTSPGAGYPFSVTVQSQDAFNASTSVTTNTSFTLSTNGNAGVIGGTITGTILAGTNSIVVSGVTLASAGTGVTVTATQTSGDPLTSGTSATFTVLEAATQLAFVGVPATGTVSTNLTSFTVEARRTDNSIDTFYNTNIILTKGSGSGNLVGTSVSATPVNGVATFTSAQFDAASTYTLYANSGSLSQITSGSIVVTLLPTVIAQFDFTPFSLPAAAVVTTKDANVSVTDFAISAGTLSVGVTTGTVFPNEPYVAGSGGYTSTTQAGAKNFNFTINANNGYQIEVTSFEFNSLATSAGPSAISFDIASGASTFTANAPDTVLLPVNQTITGVNNLTTVPILIQGWLNGSRSSSGSGNFRIDDVIVKGYVTCLQPAAYNVTGGGAICVGSAGTLVGLSNSQVGINYQLKVNGSNIGSPVAGTGAAISFGNQNTIGTYTVEATNTNGTCNELIAMTGSVTIFAGATTTWTITAPATLPAWDNGVPTSTMTAIIAADYSEAANIDACTLTVNNNAVVTIPSGSNVTLNGTLTVVTGSSFTLNNNANLVQTSNAANSGDITVKRTTNPLMRFDYVMWSSPVDGTQSLLNFSPLTSVSPTVRFYTYNSSNDQYVSVGSPSTTEFQNATGYLIRLPFNHPTAPAVWNGSFVGQPNNGPISLGSLTSGLYYATGNPYPSTIDADSFITVNGLDDALYFWRKTNGATGSAYATYTLAGGTTPTPGTGASPTSAVPNGTIQVGQGFLAKATSTSFEFNNQMRIANNANQTFRSASSALSTTTVERNRIWLNLSNATATIGQTMVSYMTGATNGIDAQIDGKYINDSQTALTSIITGQEFAVQGKTLPFDVTDVVPLGFKTETEGNFSISLYDKDGLFANTTQEIYLRDNQTGAVHNLNAGAYTFTSAIGTFNGRFEVIYQNALGIDTPSLTPNNVIVYNDNNVLTINTGIFDMASVKVFDIRGRLLTEKTNINATQTTLNVTETNQILLVQVTSNEGIVVTKKVVN